MVDARVNDPGFLVAKGRFRVDMESDRDVLFGKRDQLLLSGYAGDSSEVVQITKHIEQLENQIDTEQYHLQRTHVKHLASAIFMAISNHGHASVRAVGRNATYNAVKAIAIARGYCKAQNAEVCSEISFDEGNLGALRSKSHVETVTAILFTLNVKEKASWD